MGNETQGFERAISLRLTEPVKKRGKVKGARLKAKADAKKVPVRVEPNKNTRSWEGLDENN